MDRHLSTTVPLPAPTRQRARRPVLPFPKFTIHADMAHCFVTRLDFAQLSFAHIASICCIPGNLTRAFSFAPPALGVAFGERGPLAKEAIDGVLLAIRFARTRSDLRSHARCSTTVVVRFNRTMLFLHPCARARTPFGPAPPRAILTLATFRVTCRNFCGRLGLAWFTKFVPHLFNLALALFLPTAARSRARTPVVPLRPNAISRQVLFFFLRAWLLRTTFHFPQNILTRLAIVKRTLCDRAVAGTNTVFARLGAWRPGLPFRQGAVYGGSDSLNCSTITDIARFQFLQGPYARMSSFFGESRNVATTSTDAIAATGTRIPVRPFRKSAIDHFFARLHITRPHFRHIQRVTKMPPGTRRHLDQTRATAVPASAGDGASSPFHPLAPFTIDSTRARFRIASGYFLHHSVAWSSHILRWLRDASRPFFLSSAARMRTETPSRPFAQCTIDFMIAGHLSTCLRFSQITIAHLTAILLFRQNASLTHLLPATTRFVTFRPVAPPIQLARFWILHAVRNARLRFHSIASARLATIVVGLLHRAVMIA